MRVCVRCVRVVEWDEVTVNLVQLIVSSMDGVNVGVYVCWGMDVCAATEVMNENSNSKSYTALWYTYVDLMNECVGRPLCGVCVCASVV